MKEEPLNFHVRCIYSVHIKVQRSCTCSIIYSLVIVDQKLLVKINDLHLKKLLENILYATNYKMQSTIKYSNSKACPLHRKIHVHALVHCYQN